MFYAMRYTLGGTMRYAMAGNIFSASELLLVFITIAIFAAVFTASMRAAALLFGGGIVVYTTSLMHLSYPYTFYPVTAVAMPQLTLLFQIAGILLLAWVFSRLLQVGGGFGLTGHLPLYLIGLLLFLWLLSQLGAFGLASSSGAAHVAASRAAAAGGTGWAFPSLAGLGSYLFWLLLLLAALGLLYTFLKCGGLTQLTCRRFAFLVTAGLFYWVWTTGAIALTLPVFALGVAIILFSFFMIARAFGMGCICG